MNQAHTELQDLREKILGKTEEKDRIVPQFEVMIEKEKTLEKRLLCEKLVFVIIFFYLPWSSPGVSNSFRFRGQFRKI